MAIFNIYYLFKWPQLQKYVNQSYVFCVLQVVSWCFTFVRNFTIIAQTVFNLQSRHEYMIEIAMSNVQRAITPKAGKPELWFMCSACCLIVLYSCVKFHENISGGIRVTEQTGMMEGLADRWTDTQNFRGYNIIPSLLFVTGHKSYRETCHNG